MKFSLRFKLLLSFSVIIMFLILIGYIGIRQGIAINQRVDDMYTQEVVVLENLDDLKSATYRVRGDILEFLLANRNVTREKLKGEIQEQQERIQRKIEFYKSTRLSEEEKSLLSTFIQAWKAYSNQIQKVYDLVEAGQLDEAEIYARKVMVNQFREARAAVNDLMDYNVERAEQRRQHSLELYASDKKFIITLIVLAVLVSIGISLLVSHNIVRATKEMSQIAHEIAENDLVNLAKAVDALASGDLTQEVQISAQQVRSRTKDEIGELVDVFNQMVEKLQITGKAFNNTSRNLRSVVKNLVSNANNIKQNSLQLNTSVSESAQAMDQVSKAVHEIARGATQQSESIHDTNNALDKVVRAIDSIAQGAKEQAEAVERVAASITQMAVQIQQVNQNTQNSREIGRKTSTDADQGAKVVNETIQSMLKIKETFQIVEDKVQKMLHRATEISSIVEAMDEIADQTNLLAVNAAIEAAQAGEHGRGFAIVADEVRKLAERSGKAAKQINELISEIYNETEETQQAMKNSISVVDEATRKAKNADSALKSIINSVKSVVNEVEQIAIAAQEMAVASEDVEKAMNSISVTVEENSRELSVVADSSKKIKRSLEDISIVSQSNSAAAEQVSAMVEEMGAQFYEINNVAERLSGISQDLFEITNGFKIDDTGIVDQLPDIDVPDLSKNPFDTKYNSHGNGNISLN